MNDEWLESKLKKPCTIWSWFIYVTDWVAADSSIVILFLGRKRRARGTKPNGKMHSKVFNKHFHQMPFKLAGFSLVVCWRCRAPVSRMIDKSTANIKHFQFVRLRKRSVLTRSSWSCYTLHLLACDLFDAFATHYLWCRAIELNVCLYSEGEPELVT